MESPLTESRWDKALEDPVRDIVIRAAPIKHGQSLFSLDTPPPYVNAPVHMGHATTYTLMDMFARYHRMLGHAVLFPIGMDRNGLPIEMAAEKKFGKKFNQVPREEFLAQCKQMLDEASGISLDSFRKFGISFNNYKVGEGIGDAYETDSPSYRAITQSTFIDLWHKGLMYEAERTNNYCPGCQTTIADSEINYVEKKTLFTHVRWTVKETGETILIGTTRPELLCSCACVLFHPDDARYQHLAGKHALVPIYGKPVPIKPHSYAQMDKGTGLVMMCSFGDQTDIQFFREQGITPMIAIGLDGRMNERAGFLQGMRVKEARATILEEFKKKDLIEKQEEVAHRSPVCDRSKDPIEFIAMKEFYVKQVEFKEKMRELAGTLSFYASSSRQMLLDWIDSVSIDWPVSRRRYYATEIPLWYCEECHEPYCPPKGKYYQPWRESPPIHECPHCKHKTFRGETRVFDTWFDSSISPLYILGYERVHEFFLEHKTVTVRPQGKDIVRTWLYYTLLKCYLLTGQLIFKDAWINFHVVDETGYKMSKSKGNGIDPQEIFQKFGAEPFRLWCAIEGDITANDFRCSNDRIEGASKTLNKLWNVARFISAFERPSSQGTLRPIDEWILHETSLLADEAQTCYAKYDFHTPAVNLKNFLWETFASHYLELVKTRAYNEKGQFTAEEQKGAVWTLYEVLETYLRLMAPIIPHITYRIYQGIFGGNVHDMLFPTLVYTKDPGFTRGDVLTINSAIWKAKKDANLSLKAGLPSFDVPSVLKPIEQDLLVTHTLERVRWL